MNIAAGPHVYLLDVQVRRQDDRSFVLLCEGKNLTDDQFKMLIWNITRTKVIDLTAAIIDRVSDPAVDGLIQLTTPERKG